MALQTENVWDYSRPPRLEPVVYPLRVELGGEIVAQTRNGLRVLETSHPPTYYFPPQDVRSALLRVSTQGSFCEFKGNASYWDVCTGGRVAAAAAWSYAAPFEAFAPLRDHVAFYSRQMGGCFVDGEQVRSQEGGFYGGWITSHVQGPFKGAPGTRAW